MWILVKIRDTVRRIGFSSSRGDLLYHEIKYFSAKTLRMALGEEGYAKWFYKLYLKKPLNLENPETLSEKFWWLKLNNRDPLLTICSDKVEVRDYVQKRGYAETLMPQLDILSSVDELNVSKYREEIIVKCSHNSGGHLFYNPNNPPSERELSNKKRLLAFILKQDASVLSLEWNYKNIPPRLVVEKVVRDSKGNLPKDYKIWCFSGEPRLVFVYFDRFDRKNRHNTNHTCNIYDISFQKLDIVEDIPNSEEVLEKPQNWDYMVEMAKTLSKPFPFCRVDLYNIDGKVYFGELTFYDSGGCVSLHPEKWDRRVASWIDLNSEKIVSKTDSKYSKRFWK